MLSNTKIILIGNCGISETCTGKSYAQTNCRWNTSDRNQTTYITPGFQLSGGDAPMSGLQSKDSHPSFLPALLDFAHLSRYTSLGRSRIYQLIADPDLKFPPPVKIGKSSRWLKTEIDCWLSTQAAARHQLVTE
jgi:predicted DNA-binding transcriptional regulator AlpA